MNEGDERSFDDASEADAGATEVLDDTADAQDDTSDTRDDADDTTEALDATLPDVTERLDSNRNRMREWLLLDGNRFVLAGGVLAAFLTILAAAEWAGWIPMARHQPAFYVFGSLISGNLTLITVVVSINQLLLSRELNSPGELESQIQNVIDYGRMWRTPLGDSRRSSPSDFWNCSTRTPDRRPSESAG